MPHSLFVHIYGNEAIIIPKNDIFIEWETINSKLTNTNIYHIDCIDSQHDNTFGADNLLL